MLKAEEPSEARKANALQRAGKGVDNAHTKGKSGKAGRKGKTSGKFDKGKSSPDTKGYTQGKGRLTDEQKKDIKCAYFQSKWNGGMKCSKEPCPFRHELCENKAEYDALFKPWEFFASRESSPTRSDSGSDSGSDTSSQGRRRRSSPSPKQNLLKSGKTLRTK